jgi:glycosyltransferase involved in cell wall biosynthesis
MFQLMEQTVDHPWLNSSKYFTLLAVGRLSKQKDYTTLIKAIAILKKNIPLKLIILGEGPERNSLQTLIDDEKLSDRIELHGFSENPFAFMVQADLFVLSSILEGLPMVLFEALACGCRVVSTDCPYGPTEILKNGKYGKLVPIHNPEKLADAIIESYKTNKPNTSAAKDYAQSFTIKKATLAYLKLIETNTQHPTTN